MTAYVALQRKDPSSDYGVDFPDFPGCVTGAGTPEEAQSLAAEALAFHVEGMLEDGEPVPRPTPLDIVMAESLHSEAVAFLVHLPATP